MIYYIIILLVTPTTKHSQSTLSLICEHSHVKLKMKRGRLRSDFDLQDPTSLPTKCKGRNIKLDPCIYQCYHRVPLYTHYTADEIMVLADHDYMYLSGIVRAATEFSKGSCSGTRPLLLPAE